MNNDKFVSIVRLMTTYNLQIDNQVLPDSLKCANCKSVLKDACLLPCECRFCRVCIDDMIASASKFCPGVSEDCGRSRLSDFVTDYIANKKISKYMVRCPQNECLERCRLAELEDHMILCAKRTVKCPFVELGCKGDNLVAEEMSTHFQRENPSHSEILIGMIVDIKKEVESNKKEIEMLKRSDKSRKMENEILKMSDESSKKEIEKLKSELLMKSEQIKTVMDQMEHVENENRSMRHEIQSIKEEKTNFIDRVQILSEKIEREINKSIEPGIASVTEHVDKEITGNAAVIETNKNYDHSPVRSVKDNARSIHQDSRKLIKNDTDWIKSQPKSVQAPGGGLDRIDASYEWTIDEGVGKVSWSDRTSEYFTAAVLPYKYRLLSNNYINDSELGIWLLVHPGADHTRLVWPFRGTLTITVADKMKSTACQTITRQCEISRPADNQYSYSSVFKFPHSSLTKAGLDLDVGIRISCVIVLPDAGR